MSFSYSILSSFICGICLLVIGTANPIHAILLLIRIFFLGTILLFCLQIEYYAMLFLIVYVGAIVVLFLFIIRILELKRVNVARRIADLFSFRHLIFVCFVFQVLYFINGSFFDLSSFFVKEVHIVNVVAISASSMISHLTYFHFILVMSVFVGSFYLIYSIKPLKNLVGSNNIMGNFIFRVPFGLSFISFFIFWVAFPTTLEVNTPLAYIFEANHYRNWSQLIYRTDQLRALGSVLYTEYIISIILASLLLFVSRVGALAVTLFFPKNKFSVEDLNARKRQDANNQVRRNPFFSTILKLKIFNESIYYYST